MKSVLLSPSLFFFSAGAPQAFPVLSRILGENSLLNTNVGALVISAASVDEACVWCLLALVVSTVNAGSPLDAFYVFLLLAFFVAVMLTGECFIYIVFLPLCFSGFGVLQVALLREGGREGGGCAG